MSRGFVLNNNELGSLALKSYNLKSLVIEFVGMEVEEALCSEIGTDPADKGSDNE